LVFVSVPGGTFTMGDVWREGAADERPLHAVTLSPFYMSKYEITFSQFDAFCNATGRSKPSDTGWGRGNQPVVYVSWLDARAYCEWLSMQLGYQVRLPTEAEWEYAARSGGKNKKWAGTSELKQLGDFAWFSDNSDNRPHAVGQKQANGMDLNDMAGNVWEWCFDWYDSTYYEHSPLQNPSGPSSGIKRILRGGSWGIASSCRTTNRSKFEPHIMYYEFGFRIVRPSVRSFSAHYQ
ncbi:MAG: formylglycine-generating enzyme family protein, partial [bacterium]